MIYLIYGSDIKRKREASNKLANSIVGLDSKKNDMVPFFKITDVDFNQNQLEEFIFGTGLFDPNYVILLENVLENEETEEFILSKIKEIEVSHNTFIFFERDILKPILSKFEKHSKKVEKFELDEKKELKGFNIFSITDSFGRRDKKSTWLLYQEAMNSNLDPEDVLNILFWQIKTILISKGNSEKDSGLKPFVFKKAFGFSKNFKDEELKNISSKLTSIFHENRRKTMDLKIEVEKFILESL
ncbi:MAG: hypothetical protein WDK96_03520 [Candidatus Paceibacterota bacterium]|jgi:DNA polymerase III delta subunit